jgi:type IV pilus assembly protein PilM
VGLDIGSSCVKLVELREKKGDTWELVNMCTETLSPEAIVDGAIMDSGQVSEAIRKLFDQKNIKTTDVAIALSGHSVIIKRIQLPAMSEEELAESIQWEAEQYIPFDVRDVNLAYQILKGSNLSGDGNMDVLLVAAKKDKINDYIGVVSQAGKNTVMCDVDVFALQNTYELNYDLDSTICTALVNVGASVTNFTILQGETSVFWRDISVGGNHYNDAIQKELQLSFEQAEKLKQGEEVEGIPLDNVIPLLGSVNDYVGNELKKTMDFFKNTSAGGETVDRIVLSGGSARILHLQETLAERFNAPVERLNPFQRVQVSPKVAGPEELENMAASVGVAVGLASRKVGDG